MLLHALPVSRGSI